MLTPNQLFITHVGSLPQLPYGDFTPCVSFCVIIYGRIIGVQDEIVQMPESKEPTLEPSGIDESESFRSSSTGHCGPTAAPERNDQAVAADSGAAGEIGK